MTAILTVALTLGLGTFDARDARERPLGTRPGGRPSAAFAPDGKTLTVLDGRGRVVTWDVATGRAVKRAPLALAADEFPEQVGYTPAGDLTVFLCRYRGFKSENGWHHQGTISACLWNVTAGKKSAFVPVGYGGLATSPAGDLLAFDDALWDLATGKQVRKVALPKGLVFDIRFAPTGKAVAYRVCESLAQDGSLTFVADPATGKKVLQIGEFDWDRYRFDCVSDAVFSADGLRVACCGPEGTGGIVVRELATGKVTRVVKPPKPEGPAGFAPDGRALVSWDRSGGTVRLWELVTGKERRAVKVRPWADDVLLAPDGKTVAVRKGTAVEFKSLWD
jgi:WD40 repeat protein